VVINIDTKKAFPLDLALFFVENHTSNNYKNIMMIYYYQKAEQDRSCFSQYIISHVEVFL